MLIAKNSNRWGAYDEEKPLPKNFRTRYNHFVDGTLLGLAQGVIFTRFECTSDLDSEGFSGGLGNGLGWMTKFNMKIVDILLQ